MFLVTSEGVIVAMCWHYGLPSQVQFQMLWRTTWPSIFSEPVIHYQRWWKVVSDQINAPPHREITCFCKEQHCSHGPRGLWGLVLLRSEQNGQSKILCLHKNTFCIVYSCLWPWNYSTWPSMWREWECRLRWMIDRCDAMRWGRGWHQMAWHPLLALPGSKKVSIFQIFQLVLFLVSKARA